MVRLPRLRKFIRVSGDVAFSVVDIGAGVVFVGRGKLSRAEG